MGLVSRGLIILTLLVVTYAIEDITDKKSENIREPEELSEQDDMLLVSNTKSLQPVLASSRIYDYANYDSLTARYGPQEPASHDQSNKYIIPPERLEKIRSEFMYWFFDKGGSNDNGDLQKDIHNSNPQIHKNFNFQLPFFGSRFNYTRVSLNGYLEFSDPPEHYTYPLSFPVKDWPKVKDPAFIGIFFSKCRIGNIRPDDVDQRAPGVYFRLERDLHTRTDVFGVEVRERLMWDIRTGVVGSETFIPKHAVIVTWKNVSFAGGIDTSLYRTNTFQMVIATDEVYHYAIFNYKELQWTSHTEAGGDTTGGEGGVPAYVGFNGGNGTGSVEYKPYSQASVLRDLSGRGWANGFPGRHIFRLDEKIMLGTCNKDIAGTNLPLVFAPESGNMLGGTVVNITGPCFEENIRIRCRFDTEEVVGTFVDKNRAICVQPYLNAEGYVRFEVSVGDYGFTWKGKYFVETPATATERIHFSTGDVHKMDPQEILITWEKMNLTSSLSASLTISLFGYKETTIRPQLMFIDVLESSVTNTGTYVIQPARYRDRTNLPELLELEYGFIHINLTNPETYSGSKITPVLWSKPIPLGWYFNKQWERKYGKNWPAALCDNWLMYDRYLKNFASEIPVCPCTQVHALTDKGRYLPDFSCDRDINPECLYNKGALHCVRSGAPSLEGSEQQCCYDKDGYLMMSYDQQWGSKPRRSHNLGFLPWNEANKVPTLSQWYHDVRPFYSCCFWQEEQAVGCETFRFERRPSQDCVAYQSPYVATVFGDPHVITFDEVEYTFNGKGEFVLVQANKGKELLNIQGRFEQLPDNIYGEVLATQLTAIAAQDNSSSIIEVKLRPQHAQWRYRLDVLADGKKIYFDRPALKMQHFPGVTVYTPTAIIDQSQVIIQFPSGAGVEVVEAKGFMTARVYLPWTFLNKTKGLMGNWSFDVTDEFVAPDGTQVSISTNMNDFRSVHKNFAILWLLEEGDEQLKGQSLFSRTDGKLGSFYTNKTFEPEYQRTPAQIIPANRSFDIQRAEELCGQSYQCKYDYALSLNQDMAKQTLMFREDYVAIRKTNEKTVTSCGVLETPRFGRKSNFRFVPGTKVTFECNQGFTLVGDQRRTCTSDGHWDYPAYGYTECLRRVEYEQQKGWLATGVIAAVMIPLVLIILCLLFYWKKNNSNGSFERKFSAHRKQFVNEFLNTSSNRLKRVYDKIYRTKEPVAGREPVDFSGRTDNLKDINDGDRISWEKKVAQRHKLENIDDESETSSDDEPKLNVEKDVESSGGSLQSLEREPSLQKKLSKKLKVNRKSNRGNSKNSSVSKSSGSETAIPESSTGKASTSSSSEKSEREQSPKNSDSSYQSASSSPPSPIPDFAKDSRFDRDISSGSDRSKGRAPLESKAKPKSFDSTDLSESDRSRASSPKGQQEYSSRAAAFTWGIVVLVIAPIILIALFIGYKYVKRNNIDVSYSLRTRSLQKKDGGSKSKRTTVAASD